ncbi:hypothetical protein BAE44_0022516 [Dichanthelium oligosanthes]|uniref:Uncharacterized protein n=1 Tax=Dichanthelium oligosanthes TaxID=888268 RepID=A0A1E5UUI8_9POAL|nr:hypothetical protein BAE44_0022516 [Dichanthelium oligosanthes]
MQAAAAAERRGKRVGGWDGERKRRDVLPLHARFLLLVAGRQAWPAPAPGQPLLPQQGQAAAADAQPPGRQRAWSNFPWLTILGFAFLSFNSGMAIHRSLGDRGAIAFVSFSYLDLLALFYCLRQFESAEPGSALRDWLKVAVWLLTTALTLLFSYKVAAVMPAAVALVVWIMAFGTVAGGFLAFFCYDKQ